MSRLPDFTPRCFGLFSCFGSSSLVLALLLALAPWGRGAGAAVSADRSTTVKSLGLVVVPLGRGHFNRLCVAATVEGVKGLMIVDSGASHSALSNGKYRFLLQAPDHKLPPGVPASALVNGTREPVVMVHDYHVHDVDLGALAVPLLPGRYMYDGTITDRQYDGLLGEDLLHRFHAVLDCGRLTMYLHTDPAKRLNLGPELTRAGWTRIPMTNLQNDFLVPCEIRGRRFRLVVDTGAPFTTLDRRQLLNVEVSSRDTHLRAGVVGRPAEEVGYVQLPQLTLGSYTATNLPVLAASRCADSFQDQKNDLADGRVLGLLGGNFLAVNHAIIDVDSRSLYLKRPASSP